MVTLVQALQEPLVSAALRALRTLTPIRLRKFDKLHLGAGSRFIPGWGNVDLRGRRNLIWDLTKPLPMARGSVRYIYTEHFVEHLPKEACRALLKNAAEALASGGVLRISTPDLVHWAKSYLDGEVIHHKHAGWYPKTPCEMLNDQMRLWGHQFVYDEVELTALLHECGFSRVVRVERNASQHQALRDMESRPEGRDLILEAQH